MIEHLNNTQNLNIITKKYCSHCGLPLGEQKFSLNDNLEFCCQGCLIVYQTFSKAGLTHYYDIKKNAQCVRPALSSNYQNKPWEILKLKENQEHFCNKTKNGTYLFYFYILGVHCTACVWLIDNLKNIDSKIKNSSLDLSTSIAKIEVQNLEDIYDVAKLIFSFGYNPHPILLGEENELKQKEIRNNLIRIGITAGITGNIMLFSSPIYTKLTDFKILNLFSYLNGLLFLVIFFYSAKPILKSAFTALKTKNINIDLAISFGFILGTIYSYIQLFKGNHHYYFDSLASLVFLLLISRYILNQIQMKAVQSTKAIQFLLPQTVHKLNHQTKEFETTSIDMIKPNDVIQVLPNEIIPVDGVILKGSSYFNTALFNGESVPQIKSQGENVFAGIINVSSPIEIKVYSSGNQTRIATILNNINQIVSSKTSFINITNKIAKIFIQLIFLISSITFFILLKKFNLQTAIDRTLALLIVSCPCGLGLSAPLAMIVVLGKTSKLGILIKDSLSLEKLNNIKNIIFDKTGTLTKGKLSLKSIIPVKRNLYYEDIKLIYTLESHSTHPIAQAVVEFFKPKFINQEPLANTLKIEEKLNIGIFGFDENHNEYAVKKLELKDLENLKLDQNLSENFSLFSGYYINQECIAVLEFVDEINPKAISTINHLKNLNFNLYLFSGDNNFNVEKTAQTVGINLNHCKANLSPEEKAKEAKKLKPIVMIGDGANDALSFAEADVSIAVHGSLEVCLKTADIILTKDDLTQIPHLFEISKESLKVMKRNIAFSLIYNFISITLAILGYINPLLAAVLMPISALTLFISSLLGTKKLKKLLSEKNLKQEAAEEGVLQWKLS
jgi:Cu2+-exporting ATPase/Cu+-exporting ATPase